VPLYDYECPSCGDLDRDRRVDYDRRDRQQCRSCGKGAHMLPPRTAVHTFRGGMFEHIGHEPMNIDTPEQLAQACEANDSISPYLEDSPWGRSVRKKKEI